ncbi:MAG: 30S ribosomal protein S15 [Candidatus Poribacteria bacterium]|nr:30S ribosomal protein S15 [Candidatus Poribacteria bacterium]
MALAVERKKSLIEEYKTHDGDTGSTEVQVAIINTHIRELTEHFRTHRKDHHSRQGLYRLVSKQRRLLRYLYRQNVQRYRNLITRLGIRDTISGRRS